MIWSRKDHVENFKIFNEQTGHASVIYSDLKV